MPKFLTYQRPRPIKQAKWGGGSKPPFGPGKRAPKLPPAEAGHEVLPPRLDAPIRPK